LQAASIQVMALLLALEMAHFSVEAELSQTAVAWSSARYALWVSSLPQLFLLIPSPVVEGLAETYNKC